MPSISLKVKAFTWSKDSHGLFDYESSHITANRELCQENTQIFRNQKEVVFWSEDNEEISKGLTKLCNIVVSDQGMTQWVY